MTTKPSEADIIFNRANVALAKSQRLVASWLPTRTDAESKNAKTDEQIEKEEQEMFTPVPEVYVCHVTKVSYIRQSVSSISHPILTGLPGLGWVQSPLKISRIGI